MRRILLIALSLLLIGASTALAQDPVPTTPTTPTTPVPPPAPVPVAAKIRVALKHVGHVGRPLILAGHGFGVLGKVTPYVAGQRVVVRFRRLGRVVHQETVTIKRAAGGKGRFLVGWAPKRRGKLRIDVTHDATPQMAAAHVNAPGVEALADHAIFGATNRTVLIMQRLLRQTGYVPNHRGLFGPKTARAVLAFRKMMSMPRTTAVTPKFLSRLLKHQGRHAEGDLTHQVLALIDGDKVERLYPISSGKPSTPTVLGTYRIYMRTPGYLPDGMYYSSFFTGGYAIHGYDPSPTYPASHGCMRTPIPDAIEIYNWLALGDYVDTYYRTGRHRHPKPSPDAGP